MSFYLPVPLKQRAVFACGSVSPSEAKCCLATHRDLGMLLLALALVTLHFTMRCLVASQQPLSVNPLH